MNIDLELRNKSHGPMHYKKDVTCIYNGHVLYTMDTWYIQWIRVIYNGHVLYTMDTCSIQWIRVIHNGHMLYNMDTCSILCCSNTTI